MAQRVNYWSCTPFADWLRGTMKPKAASGPGWRDWEVQAKTNHPIRYWIVEEGLDMVQNVLWYPVDRLYDVKYWINNRFVTRTHAMTSNLPRGQWHEFDTRLLHCMFDELVNFVEIEQAWFHTAWDLEARKKYRTPFYGHGWFRWRTWRCSEAGLSALDWASKLVKDEDWGIQPGEPGYGELTSQAEAALELITLYKWWKEVRPARPDAMDASGWTAYCEMRREKGYAFFDMEDKTPEEVEMRDKALDLSRELEEQYDNEDEQMMIRLIKLRKSLWT